MKQKIVSALVGLVILAALPLGTTSAGIISSGQYYKSDSLGATAYRTLYVSWSDSWGASNSTSILQLTTSSRIVSSGVAYYA